MKNDIESDFWKDVFVHLQHKNMVRVNGEHLLFEDVKNQFSNFEKKHPEIVVEKMISDSYCTLEFFVTGTVKFRLFIQSQIKGSLLQKIGNDFVKITDAKFPFNPFPEIEEFILNKDKLIQKLETQKKEFLYQNQKLKIAGEFINAYVFEKMNSYSDVLWNLEPQNNSFILTITKNQQSKYFELPLIDFKTIIDSISIN